MVIVRESYGQGPKIQYVQSPTDINWDLPLHEQLEPQFFGGPDPKKSTDELHAIRRQIPKLTETRFKAISPREKQATITVVGRNHSRHYVQLQKAATWILNAVQWFNVLQQPMMIVIWCQDWEDAANFQYLMQILQVNFEDYIPNWQIFVEKLETVDKMVKQWQNPTTGALQVLESNALCVPKKPPVILVLPLWEGYRSKAAFRRLTSSLLVGYGSYSKASKF